MELRDKLQKFTSEWVQATREPLTKHPLAALFRQDFKKEIERLVKSLEPDYEVNASVGQGAWANIPWLSILNPRLTETTEDGIYPVYLFKADGSGFYLSLNQGTTKPTKLYGKTGAEARAQDIKKGVLSLVQGLKEWGEPEIDLSATTPLGKSYEKFNISAKYYDAENIPSTNELETDLRELLNYYQQIGSPEISKLIYEKDSKLQQEEKTKNQVGNITSLSKPFILLAGISGTGKTRFIREQAKATGSLSETYCLTPVRPDWHEPSDLLGYTSRLNGKDEYIATDVLRFIAKAWRAKVDAGLSLSVNDSDDEQNYCLAVSGGADELSEVLPYWLCLDEMNLAPVEQYFSDYLSILETREWSWDGSKFSYSSDPLLTAGTIKQLKPAEKQNLRDKLELASDKYNCLWDLICAHGMGIPFNLMVAGTVNMDETTHGFSRKVIDRALSFDFGEFFPNIFATFFDPKTCKKTLTYPLYSHANKSQEMLPNTDPDGQKSIEFLTRVNTVLKDTPFELAYRALNELLLAVICEQPKDERHLKAVWDDFLMCKVLPRIEGDSDKLSTDGSEKSLLTDLLELLNVEFAEFWNEPKGSGTARLDLYRENIGVEGDAKVLRIPCRSKAKLEWMQKRLERSTFTSFWP